MLGVPCGREYLKSLTQIIIADFKFMSKNKECIEMLFPTRCGTYYDWRSKELNLL